MKSPNAMSLGLISLFPLKVATRPQIGGKRPPNYPSHTRRVASILRPASAADRRKTRRWLHHCGALAVGMLTIAAVGVANAASSALPNLTGTYRCEGDASICSRSGTTFTVTQTGEDLSIKNEKGEIGSAKLTSTISISAGPTWNMLGVIHAPDNRVITWSNGTSWRKQS